MSIDYNKIKEAYYGLIYQYNENLLMEEMFAAGTREPGLDGFLIAESQYFSEVPQQLEDYIFDLYKNKVCKSGYEEVSIKDVLSKINKNNVKNYRGFHSYLDLLKDKSNGTIAFISDNGSYFEPPIDMNQNKIRFFDDKKMYNDVATIDSEYNDYLDLRFKQIKDINELYKKLRDKTLYIDDFGTIAIKMYDEIKDENEHNKKKKIPITDEELRVRICHEIAHLLAFLARISGINHDICMYYGKQPIDDYNEIGGVLTDQKEYPNYLNDPNEFKTLAETYISRLVYTFINGKFTHDDQNVVGFLKSLIHSIFTRWYTIDQYIEQIHKTYEFNSIRSFMKAIYKDSKYQGKINYRGRNKWKTFKKWLVHSFNKSFNTNVTIDQVFNDNNIKIDEN